MPKTRPLAPLLLLLLAHAAHAQALTPPVARKLPHEYTVHGERHVDDYYWLRNKGTPEVDAYLRAENAYADAVMKPTAALRERLYQEMVGRLQEDDATVPYREGSYLYYQRTQKGKQYPVHFRRAAGDHTAEETLLDLNALGARERFVGLGELAVSDDEQRLAYSLDTSGAHDYVLYVKDLRTGALGPERIRNVHSFAWAADSRTLFYVTADAALRPCRVYRHQLGGAADALVFEEKDERFVVEAQRTRSGAYLELVLTSATASEVWVLPAARPTERWAVIAPRAPNHEYFLGHRGDTFYIRTNSGSGPDARNFRVVTAPVAAPQPANWKQLVAARPDTLLEHHDLFANHLVLTELGDGLPRLRVIDLRTRAEHLVSFPDAAYDVELEENRVFDSAVVRFAYSSLVTPRSIFDYDADQRERKLLKVTPLRGYDPSRYQVERVQARAGDGALIPISLVYRKGLQRDGKAPLQLYAYGAYGMSSEASFTPELVSLLDRGVVYGIAHIRGGAELGKRWHDQGRMMAKRNSFTDFIACAEHLVQAGYTSPARLAIEGGSAGGLLMGAVANLRPDLFHAVVARVPFVDVINTMLDTSIPLTVGEFEEWGDPRIRAEYDYMKSYSPYDNVSAQRYPALLVKTSLNDSNVPYWEPAKWVARLRALKTDDHPLLLRTNLEPAGHHGASGRYDRLREVAYQYAFVLWQLGINQ